MFGAALFGGALLAWPLYQLAAQFSDPEFSSIAKIATQLCGLAVSLLYLKYTDRLSCETLGLKSVNGYAAPLSAGFIAGLLLFGGLALLLFLFGLYGLHGSRELSLAVIMKLLLGALLTGLAVALFEETVFRGALLQGLRKQAGMNRALVTVSLVYAAVHFIDYAEPAAGETVGWLTAPQMFVSAYTPMFSLQTLDALLALFVLGLLLGLIRLKTGNLIQCIGVHAGIVAGVKLFRFFAEYRPDNSFAWLVSPYDLRLGWLATLWLLLATAAYFVHLHRKPKTTRAGAG